MSNPSHRSIFDRYSNLNNFKIKETKLPAALENMCCEIYNPGTEKNFNLKAETAHFKSNHPMRMQMHFFGLPPTAWLEFTCAPGDWLFLPHGEYLFTVPSGNPAYRMIINVGDAMFKGNKLPSRPEATKIRSFGGL